MTNARVLSLLVSLFMAFQTSLVYAAAPTLDADGSLSRFRTGPDDPYPVPRMIARQADAIEKELTPAEVALASDGRQTPAAIEDKCLSRVVRIQNRPSPNGPLDEFSAIVRWPRERAALPARLPIIVMQPTLMGPGELENKGIAQALCAAGMGSIVPTETKLGLPPRLPDLGAYDGLMRTEMLRARSMVEVAGRELAFDPARIGAIGFSRGGIAGALLAGIEPRIKASFLGAGGVGLARIIARSQTERGKEETGRQLAAFAAAGDPITIEEFERRLMRTLRYDGALFLHRVPPSAVKTMIVANDLAVPTESQELLYKILCRENECPARVSGVDWALQPELIPPSLAHVSATLGGVHVASILDLVYRRSHEFVDFFARTFEKADR